MTINHQACISLRSIRNQNEQKELNATIMKILKPGSHTTTKCSRKFVLLAIFPIVLLFSFTNPFQALDIQEGDSVEIFCADLNQRIPKLMNFYDIPGVNISIIKQGQIIWTQAYGYADLETGRMMTTDTYLRVQSISKSVTAWGVMKLVEQGKIDLDRPVQQYLKTWTFPESAFSESNVTVRQLLSHTAGMPLGDFFNFYSPESDIPTLKESLTKEAVLFQEPGSSFFYSNTGFNLLELLIEEVTDRDFAEYMQQEILIPLGMLHSSFTWNKQFDPPVPLGYGLTGKAVPVYIYPEKGSGGLFATVEDIAAFVASGMPGFSKNQHVLNPQSIHQLYTPMAHHLGLYSLVFDSYGFGHYIENLSNGKKAVSHGGQGTGWMTHFHAVPESGDGIVILTNSQRSWPLIAHLLMDWAKWNGFIKVGMGRILWGIKLMWGLMVVIGSLSLWNLWQWGVALMRGGRKFAPLSKEFRLLRIGQATLFMVTSAGLLWCLNQDYLFISSVFPLVSDWLGISLFAFAIVMLLLALFPKKVSLV